MLPTHGLIGTRIAIAEGRLDPNEAVAACWKRARALEPDLQAFAHLPVKPPEAGRGALAGVAVGMKDLIDTADMPTSYGSPIYRDHKPDQDAWIVALLRSLGATILGKTVSTEFAWQHPGPTRNPWNHWHTPGGSSSGSAAAVAAGIVPLAIGTQTFGSVIRPAAFCGIVGFKPTFGTLPREGVHPLSGSLDHVGLFARSVDDIAVAHALLVPEPRLGRDLRAALRDDGLDPGETGRFAALAPADAAIEPAQRHAFETAIQALRRTGATVDELRLPDEFGALQSLAETLVAYEAARIFEPLMRRSPGRLSPPLKALLDRGAGIDDDLYAEALERQKELRARFASVAGEFGAILTIPAAGEAPRGLQSTGDARFCVQWSTLGVPAVTLPVTRGPSGLPLGLQIVGGWEQDVALLRIAKGVALALEASALPGSATR